MDDEILLQLAKTRITNLQRRGKSLKQLCLQYIGQNFDILLSSNINLPVTLRNELLEELCKQQCPEQDLCVEEEYKAREDILELLLNKYTGKLDLAEFLSFCPWNILFQSVTQLIRTIAANASDLRELTIKKCIVPEPYFGVNQHFDDDDDDDDDDLEVIDYVPETLEGELAKLSKLTSLKLGASFSFPNFTQLALLCSRLPNLQVVYATFQKSAESVIDAAFLDRCFPSLISYLLTSVHGKKKSNLVLIRLHEICNSNAAALKNIYISKSRNSCCQSYSHTFFTGSPGKFRKVFLEADRSGRLVDCELPPRDMCAKYFTEDLTRKNEEMVSASAASAESTPISIYRHILCEDGDYETVLWHLERVGKELHTLIVESVSGNSVLSGVNLARTLELCPKLERLVFNCIAWIVEHGSLAPFVHLRELNFDDIICSDGSEVLAIILSAPNLEKVTFTIEIESIKVGSLKRLLSLIADGVILRKLVSLDITLSVRVLTDAVSDVKEFCEFLKMASSCLPNLADLRFYTFAYESFNSRVYFQVKTKEKLDEYLLHVLLESEILSSFCEDLVEYFENSNLIEFMSLY